MAMCATVQPRAEMFPQKIVGDGKQVSSKRGLFAEAIPSLHAGEEGPLNHVLGAVIELVGEEAPYPVEVALEQGTSAFKVPPAPGRQ